MSSLQEILKDPNYINANEATKRAIFERYAPLDQNYTGANGVTQAAIRQRFGIGEITIPAAPPPPEKESAFRQVADIPLGIAKGAVQGVRMIADAFGAGTDTSKTIKSAETYLADLMSAQSKNDQQEISRIMKDAEDKGVLDQVKAGIKAFTVAPIDTLSSALGTAAPVIAGALGAQVLGAGALVSTGVSALTGAGMGAGTIKGSIYEETKSELKKAGASEEDAEAKAQLAQQYNGKNLDQILLGTVLGGAAAVGPLEKGGAAFLARKILGKTGAEATETVAEQAAKGALRRRAEAGVLEAIPEAVQAGQEKVAQNIALQREGFEDVPTFRGAAGAMTLEAIAGGGLGATLGGGKPEVAKAPEPPAPRTGPLTPEEQTELDRQRAAAERPKTTEELLAGIQTEKPTTSEDIFRIRDEHETAVIEGLLAQDVEMKRAADLAAQQREQQKQQLALESEAEAVAGGISDIDTRVREGRIFSRVQDLIDRNIPYASTAINDINQKFGVINEAPLTEDERARVENIMGMVNTFTNFVNLPVLAPKPVDQFAENQAMEALIKERTERGQAEPLRTTPPAPSPRIEETPVSQGIGEGAALRPTSGVEPSVTKDRELVTSPTALAVEPAAAPRAEVTAVTEPAIEAPKVVTVAMLTELGVKPTAAVVKRLDGASIDDPKVAADLESYANRYATPEVKPQILNFVQTLRQPEAAKPVTEAPVAATSVKPTVPPVTPPAEPTAPFAAPGGFVSSVTLSPTYEGIEPLSVEDADFELEALQNSAEKGRLTPEQFASSEIGKRLDTAQIGFINEGLRTDPVGTITALRDRLKQATAAPAAPPVEPAPVVEAAAPAEKPTFEPKIVSRQPAPDGMEVHVFTTTDGYGTGLFDADAGQYVDGSITRFAGSDTLPKAENKAAALLSKATPAAPAEPSVEPLGTRKEAQAFGKAIGAAQPYPGELRGRVNLPAQKAAKEGNFQGVLSALEKSKNVIVAEIAKRARTLGTKIVIDDNAEETYTGPSPIMRQMSIDGAKMHLEALNKIRALAPQVDAMADGASLGYDYRAERINAIDQGKDAGSMSLADIAKMGHSMFAPLATGPINLRTKEDFKRLQKAYEDLTSEYGENALQLTSTGSAEMRGVAGVYDANTDTIRVPEYTAKREEVLSHEIVHAQTVQAVANPTLRQKPIVARLNKLYEHVKKELEGRPGRAPYGIQSIQEFIAEGMGNPAFQFLLKKIKYENTSAWDSFVKTIADLIGVKRDTAFTELLSIYSDLTTEQKAAPKAEAPAVEAPVAPEIAPLQDAYNKAKSALDAIGTEPAKPSPEARYFGMKGREGAAPELVRAYDEKVKAYNSWKRKYSKLKKEEVEASNVLFRAKQAQERKSLGGAKAQQSNFEQTLRILLNKFGLKDVGLSIIEGMQDAGSYAQQLIRIADRADNPIRTLRHEAIHALRELGFFTDAQWSSLSKMAKDKWIDQYLKQRNVDGKPLKAGEESRYDAYMREYNGDMEKITEEAVADAFADFDASKPPAGLLQALLKRMKDLFQSIKSALTKVESVDQIFGKVEEGKLKPDEKTEAGERKSIGGVSPGQQALETISRMGMGVKPPEPGKVAKLQQILKDAGENPAGTKASAKAALTKWLDAFETMAFSGDAAFNNKVTSSVINDMKENEEVLGKLLELSQSQAVNADNVVSRGLIEGSIEYNEEMKKYQSVKKDENFAALIGKLEELSTKYGTSPQEMERIAHAYLVAKRLPGIIKRNEELNTEIAAEEATAKPDRKSIDKWKSLKVYVSPEQEAMVDDGISLGKTIPELSQISDMWNAIRKNNIAVMVESGLYTPEYAQQLWDNMDYVPYYREEQLEADAGPTEFIRGLQVKAKEFQLKGSGAAVNDVFENMMLWSQYAMNRAIRADKARRMIDVAKDIDIGDRKMAVQVKEEKRGMNIVRVFRDGKQEMWDLADPMFVPAFAAIQNVSIPMFKWAAKVADVLRNSVVLYPMFSVAQVPQDSFAAMFTSGLKPQHALKIPILAVKEFIKTLNKTSATHNELVKYGVVGARNFSAEVMRNDAEIFAGLKPPKGGWNKTKDFLEHIAMSADNAVRQAVYEAAQQQGVSKQEALEKAFEIFNVRRRGTSKALNLAGQTIPFFYAYLAAQRVAYRTITGIGTSPTERKAALQTLASTSAAVFTLSMLYAMMVADDEDYAETPAAVRDRTLTIPGTGGVRIPLRADFFLFPKMIAEHTYLMITDQGYEDGAKFRRSMRDGLINAIASPTPLPQIAKPALEVLINYSFFDGKPVIGTFEKQKDMERQFNDSTSEFSKLLGKTGLVSPIAADHLIRGMLGSAGGLALYGTNMFLHSDPDVPRPEMSWKEAAAALPGTSGFLKRPQESALKNDFFVLRDEVEKAINTFNDIKTRSPQGIEDFLANEKKMARLMLGKPVDKINRELSKIRKVITQITNMPENQMSADDKSDNIRQLRELEREILKSVNVKELREMAKI